MPGKALITLRYPNRGARQVIEAQAASLPHGWSLQMDRAAAIHVEELRKRTPVGKGGEPGKAAEHMRDQWAIRRVDAGGKSVRSIYNKKKALRYVLRGRPAIDNTGKGHPLHFWSGGKEFYRWRVKATRPNPFHINAMRAARGRIVRDLSESTRSLLARSRVRKI